VADEGKGAERGQLPEEVGPEDVVRGHQAVHGPEEEDQEEEEPPLARASQVQMLLVGLHVGQGEDADERADDGDDQDHDERQAIDDQGRGDRPVLRQRQFENGQGHELQERQDGDPAVLALEADAQDDQQQGEVGQRDQAVQRQAQQRLRRGGESSPAEEAERSRRQQRGRDQHHAAPDRPAGHEPAQTGGRERQEDEDKE